MDIRRWRPIFLSSIKSSVGSPLCSAKVAVLEGHTSTIEILTNLTSYLRGRRAEVARAKHHGAFSVARETCSREETGLRIIPTLWSRRWLSRSLGQVSTYISASAKLAWSRIKTVPRCLPALNTGHRRKFENLILMMTILSQRVASRGKTITATA